MGPGKKAPCEGGGMQEITVIAANKVGTLADVCELLGGSGVNIESFTGYGVGDTGVIRFVTKDANSAKKVLERAGFRVSVGEVVVVELSDKPGELGKLARKLARKGVNIESIYLLSKGGGFGDVAIKTDDPAAAEKALK
jgi:hypothetical protein